MHGVDKRDVDQSVSSECDEGGPPTIVSINKRAASYRRANYILLLGTAFTQATPSTSYSRTMLYDARLETNSRAFLLVSRVGTWKNTTRASVSSFLLQHLSALEARNNSGIANYCYETLGTRWLSRFVPNDSIELRGGAGNFSRLNFQRTRLLFYPGVEVSEIARNRLAGCRGMRLGDRKSVV